MADGSSWRGDSEKTKIKTAHVLFSMAFWLNTMVFSFGEKRICGWSDC
jgi:hypothetical protein